MLRGISPLISPDLLKTLHEMGHGDELLLADAHFPGHSLGQRVLRADGLAVTSLLEAILPLFELDNGESPLTMMEVADPAALDPEVEADYMGIVLQHLPHAGPPERIPRADFYDRGRHAFSIVLTGETRPYGNLLLRKGVTSS